MRVWRSKERTEDAKVEIDFRVPIPSTDILSVTQARERLT